MVEVGGWRIKMEHFGFGWFYFYYHYLVSLGGKIGTVVETLLLMLMRYNTLSVLHWPLPCWNLGVKALLLKSVGVDSNACLIWSRKTKTRMRAKAAGRRIRHETSVTS